MRILVTGGAGFVGSHLIDTLLAEGHSLIALDNISTGRIENLESARNHPNFEYIEGSVLNQNLLEELISRTDYIFHLDRKSTRLNSSHVKRSRMPSSA